MQAATLDPVLILGATSGMARAVAGLLARRGHPLRLAARDAVEVRALAADLAIRHQVEVLAYVYDAASPEAEAQLRLAAEGTLAGVLVAFGVLDDQREAERSRERAAQLLHVNFTACALACETVAEALQAQGHGWLCVIGSVAGDRGRQSNYLYGAAKGGLAVYTQGLRHRLKAFGVAVITIKPGFVDTAMTWGKPGMFLVATPEQAAEGIVRAIDARRAVAYVPGFWRLVMALIRGIPGPLFERSKL
ncbi:MAG: SDR family NAD(P)-dependent oxidoreductase [Candidatus Sericytochromatia bacterium]|nr:SDR family NAD(P)-dependent oxidoreductase [Candidatus Sericytochromatia bacterium]